MIAILGSMTIGLVWGWLLVLLGGRHQQPWPGLLLLGLATLLAAAQFFFLIGRQSLLYFLVAAALSLLLHLGWRRSLRRAAS